MPKNFSLGRKNINRYDGILSKKTNSMYFLFL